MMLYKSVSKQYIYFSKSFLDCVFQEESDSTSIDTFLEKTKFSL